MRLFLEALALVGAAILIISRRNGGGGPYGDGGA